MLQRCINCGWLRDAAVVLRACIGAVRQGHRNVGFAMSVGLSAAFGQNGAIDDGFLAAFSIVYAAPVVVVYFLLRRNLNTGFAGVGVKG